MSKQRRQQKPKLVRESERRKMRSPQPPHADRRTKRQRTRADEKRQSIKDHS